MPVRSASRENLTESTLTCEKFFAILLLLSPVAQLAEQVAVNHWVRGSNPRGGVYSRLSGRLFYCLFCFTTLCNSLLHKELAIFQRCVI